MNRNHLALFHAVAHAGGISRGAEHARVSQPAVSKQISELESALGVRLLDRLPRGCRLTEAGQLLAGYARQLISLEEEAVRSIEEFRGLKKGRLAVGASTTIGAYLLPRLLGEYHRQYPEIELRLEIANTHQIQRWLSEGKIEIAFTEGLIEAEELDSEVFAEDELVAIAPPGHALAKQRNVLVRDFCHEPFILREEGSGTRAVIERALKRRGITVQPILSLASPEAIKHAVIAGLGVAIISRLAVTCEVQAGPLQIVPLKDLTLHRPLHLQRLRGRSQSPAVAKFLELLPSRKNRPARR
jgi:DNA-binding transcriptional LysR family regulator